MRIIVEGLQTSVTVIEQAVRELGYSIESSGGFIVSKEGHEVGAVRSPVGLGRPFVEIHTRFIGPAALVLLVEKLARFG